MRGCVLLCLVLACLVALTAGYRRGHRPHHRRRHHYPHGPKSELPIKIFPQGSHPPSCFERVVDANRLLGVDLYKKLKHQRGNIILSPFSISAALAMTYAGAGGTTKSQMEKALRFDIDNFPPYCSVKEGFKNLLHTFAATKYNHTLKVVNQIFVDSTLRLKDSYKAVTKNYYGAEAAGLPFSSMSSLCRGIINGWVKEHTDGKIVDLLPAGSLTSETVLALVNAITFKGYWKHKFADSLTKKEPFHQSSKTTTSVKMMHTGCGPHKLRYAFVRSLKSQVVELPFYNSKVAMYFVLPRKNVQLSYVEKKFSWNPDSLGLATKLVQVSIPKFTAKKSVQLSALLKALGMKDLFNRNKSNLTDVSTSSRRLWLDKVYHQAYINVDESGTEAAAATTACIARYHYRRRRTINFVANRPFLFFLWDKETNSLLFNGRFQG